MSLTESRSGAGRASPPQERGDSDLLAAAPALVRLAAAAYLRALGWGLHASVRTADGALKVVLPGEGAEALVESIGGQLREQLRRLLGVTDIEARLGRMPEPPNPEANGRARGDHLARLRERGAELLARSAGVDDSELTHPAYERILTSLAPDEARILRLVALEGARAAVDVRTWRPVGGSEVVETGLTMIGLQAGCRYLDRVPVYLNNLSRLGLISLSLEPLEDLSAYQVLEVQPEVQAALSRAGRAKTVRRSVRMTPFGRDFCEVCLPLDTAGFLAVKNRVSDGAGVGPGPTSS